MEYVMVPVPEGHEQQVHRFIAWLQVGRQLPDDVDPDTVLELIDQADDQMRRLLAVAAEAGERSQDLTVTEAARRVGVGPRELSGLVTEVNQTSRRIGGARNLLVLQSNDDEDDEDGEFGDRLIVRLKEWATDRVLMATGVGVIEKDDKLAPRQSQR